MDFKAGFTGIAAAQADLRIVGKQMAYAASRALNTVAFAINAFLKEEMNRIFQGGATAYTLRAFKIEKATKQSLVVTIALRNDAPDGGTPYNKALHHLFTGGTRDWKKVEGLLRGIRKMPAGFMAVPGAACPLDSRGNIRRPALTEMLNVIKSDLRNLRVFRKTGNGKPQKGIGYFVVMPGDKSRLHPGIWKRIETGGSSTVKPMVMYVRPGKWRQFIDLKAIGQRMANEMFEAEFRKELANAMRTAR